MALNQAILRGNPFMINTLIEHGSPSPFVRDGNGKGPIHVAASKLNYEVFEDLLRVGFDPMLPDAQGNTFLHIMAQGVIKDREYDFIKKIFLRHEGRVRLSRNKEGLTALNILKQNSSQGAALRGQPNYKRKLATFFDERIAQKPTLLDAEKDTPITREIKAQDLSAVRGLVNQTDGMSGAVTKEVMDLFECRDNRGRTALFAAVEHGQLEIVNFLLDFYPHLDLNAKDTVNGDSVLHVACRNGHVDLAKRLLDLREERALQQNFRGETPVLTATQVHGLYPEVLPIFEKYKFQALQKKDEHGENPLFECARTGDEAAFNWFCGDNEFYRARGQQNYKGQTIEHICCINRQACIVDEIKPRPDTVDYYGNLPLYYTLQHNDVTTLQKIFPKTQEYFKLRNYKYETVFHICARHNSAEALKAMLGRTVFISQLLRKDYVGNTAFHVAAKSGSMEVLQFLCSAVTPNFLKIQNDFGFTALEAAQEKYHLVEDQLMGTKSDQNTPETVEKLRTKLQRLQDVCRMLMNYQDWVTEESWNQRFDL